MVDEEITNEEITNEENEENEEEDTQLNELKKRIPYDEDIHLSPDNYENMLNSLLEDSKEILLGKLFPFEDFSTYEVPTQYQNWQIRCCVELYNLADKQGITSYAENGLSWTKLSDGLSLSLMNQLISRAGIPNRSKITRNPQNNEE